MHSVYGGPIRRLDSIVYITNYVFELHCISFSLLTKERHIKEYYTSRPQMTSLYLHYTTTRCTLTTINVTKCRPTLSSAWQHAEIFFQAPFKVNGRRSGKNTHRRLSPRKKSVQISRQIGWPTWLLFFFLISM